MKKQILILMLALFTLGVSTAYAQLVPREIECLDPDDALHPIPGNEYLYQINVPNWNWTDGIQYRWFVTQDPNFITGGTLNEGAIEDLESFFEVTGGSAYNVTTLPGGQSEINITWYAAGYVVTEPIFVGIYVVGDDGLCTPNNLKIYLIEPQLAFTLDIANRLFDNTGLAPGAYGEDYDQHCMPDVVSASYDATLAGIVYDFGVTYMYYEVVAANWSLGWQLSVELDGVQVVADPYGQTAEIHYSTSLDFSTVVAMSGPADFNGVWTTNEVITPSAGNNVGSDGESVYIRLTLYHNGWEGVPDAVTYTLAVDGQLMVEDDPPGTWVGTGLFDLHHDDTDPLCGEPDGFENDIALQTLRPRPQIQAVEPAYLPNVTTP